MRFKNNINIACYLLAMYQSIHCAEYLGKFIGKLSELHHGVSGEVYAVDGRTLHIKDFTYDGQGPAAYFWIGNTRTVTSQGFRIRDENGSPMVLRRYRKEGVTITLPEKKTINNIKWFSIWCEEFEVNFGDVKIPGNFEYPRPQKINALNGVHGISSDNIVVVDAQTLLIPNLSYDGEAPDAKFWVGRGSKPSPQGIRVPNENGIEGPLMRYDRKTVVLTLPGDVTVFNIGHFGIWCEAFTVDFGHIVIPNNLNIPPSLKMLGISPQKRRQMFQFSSAEGLRPQSLVVGGNFEATTYRPPSKINHQLISQHTRLQPSTDSIPTFQTHHANHTYLSGQTALKNLFTNSFQNPDIMYQNPQIHQHQLPLHPIPYQLPSHYNSKLNCEVLYDKLAFEVRWAIAGDSIVMQLVAKLDNGEYMSFGISGDSKHSTMIGGDVVVAWIDKNTLEGFAVDYFLGHKSQCSGSKGSCPDKNITPNSESVRLLNAATVNGYSIITYQRPLVAFDELDKSILTNLTQPIIWAIGPLNERNEVSFHSHYTKTDKFINFGRSSKWNCPIPEGEQQTIKVPSIPHKNESNTTVQITTKPWHIPPIKCYEPEDGVFYAQMGPTGGKQGYPAITGRVGWGISWYINGLLIPEIYVVRGKTYTFVVEGGIDPEVPAKYHPFYITDDPVGGYEYKTPEEKKNVRIFAGTTYLKNRTAVPTGVGRLCHWTQQGDLDADNFQSFGAYQRTLELKCDQGEPGVVLWKPDKDTPDVVYYQCFTHRYLGWKIHVLDECDQQLDESKQHAVYIKPNNVNYESEIPKNTETLSQISTVNSKRAINKNAEHYTHGYIPAIPVTIISSSPTRQKNISEFQILKNVDLDLGYNVQQPLGHPTVQSLDSHVNNKLNYNDNITLVKIKNHRHKVYKRLANQQKIFLQNKSELQLEEVDASFKATKKELTYYLPPPGRNIAPKERNLKPSNIDIAPGKVVTYDGKEISGSSLTAHENVKGFIDKTPSKTSEFLKETPQFVPYKGDLPPLNPFIDLNAPQLKGHGSLNRNLDTPLSPQTTYTKLLRVGT